MDLNIKWKKRIAQEFLLLLTGFGVFLFVTFAAFSYNLLITKMIEKKEMEIVDL